MTGSASEPFLPVAGDGNESEAESVASGTREVTLGGATAELVVTQLGSGILLLPGAFSKAGVITSLGVLSIVGYAASNRAEVLAECMERFTGADKPTSFPDVARHALGRGGEIVVSISFSGTLYSCCLAYLILIGELLAGMFTFPGTTLLASAIIWKGIVAMMLLVVTISGGMTEMQRVGIAGSLASVVTGVCIVAAAICEKTQADHPMHFVNTDTADVLGSITTFCYCYGAIQTLPMIARDMHSRSTDLVPAVRNAHIFSTLVFSVVGFAGYVGFGNTVTPEVLDSLKGSYTTLWHIGSIGILVHVALAIPVLMNMVARSVEQRLQRKPWTSRVCRSLLMTLLYMLACTPIAIFSDFVVIIPASTVTLNCFIWPTLMYWGFKQSQHGGLGLAMRHSPRRFISVALIALLALVATFFGTRSAILQLNRDMRSNVH